MYIHMPYWYCLEYRSIQMNSMINESNNKRCCWRVFCRRPKNYYIIMTNDKQEANSMAKPKTEYRFPVGWQKWSSQMHWEKKKKSSETMCTHRTTHSAKQLIYYYLSISDIKHYSVRCVYSPYLNRMYTNEHQRTQITTIGSHKKSEKSGGHFFFFFLIKNRKMKTSTLLGIK